MSESIPYADIIILALIAGFILLRLRSVLGQKTGNENPNFFRRDVPKAAAEPVEPVVQLGDKLARPRGREDNDSYLAGLEDGPIAQTLAAIKAKDPVFSATEFMMGARMAFEMVHDAFAKGDKDTLLHLLSDNLYKEFSAEIDKHAQDENKTETTLVSVAAKEITQASLNGNIGQLKVRFVSEQVHLVRNKAGEIIEGNASEQHHVEDEWLFERDVTSKNPNWKIIET